jgi:predicted enzyme related to lactoylglutathione lyase
MIRGLHGLFYSSEPEATREFLRDKVQLPFTDVGGGWLIFDLAEGDLGVHPVDPSGGARPGTHDVSFYCDDIEGTVAELRARGVQFTQEIADRGYGWVTYFTLPGGIEVQLYEPKYAKRAKRATRAASSARKRTAGARARALKKGGKTTRGTRRPR